MNNNQPQKNDFRKLNLEELEELYKLEPYIPYHELLRAHQWDKKRNEIFTRDDFRCQKCNGFSAYYNKEGSLVWGNADLIIWEDLNGVTQFSVPTKPMHKPDKEYQMHVHHKKYIKNRYPWQYNNDDLITLCHHCHWQVHENNIIPVFDENGIQLQHKEPCNRCGGKGRFSEYSHVEGGICFKCRGLGYNIILIDKKLR